VAATTTHHKSTSWENTLLQKFWQSWVDVFDIEQRGLDRSHEYLTGVFLILQKFPNLRYRCGQREENPRDPKNAARVTGIAEYPFNDGVTGPPGDVNNSHTIAF
jgi:hypothetical protein